jgi:hypothetical protein
MSRTRGSKTWTQAHQEQLIAGIAAGEDPETIAKKTKMSVSTVRNKANEQNLSFSVRSGCPWRDDEDQTLIDMAMDGFDAQDISARIPGRAPRSIYSRARTLIKQGVDIPIPELHRTKVQHRSMADEALLGMISLRAASLPLNRIAEAFC